MENMHRLRPDQYHRMFEIGVLTDRSGTELVGGYLVVRHPRGFEHERALVRIDDAVCAALQTGWTALLEREVTFTDSVLTLDFAIARTGHAAFPNGLALAVEASASSLAYDRIERSRVYARAGIPVYWIVNVIDKQIEVLTDPSGPCDAPAYGTTTTYTAGQQVPLALDGNTIGHIAVSDVFG